ncbi:uncharacterized protein LOC109821606 [Asparagus officinalis]|uniref:uncharacterized protein LOC109821606 n=1 Tax=Asparagus officinalis TaxID=4686 RepID=UPI00098E6C38|nr:uncharacterized protein LOC109821606 [Asparagus officinalis]
MLEDIRLALMDRMQQKFKLLETFHLISNIAPSIYKKLQEAYEEQKKYEIYWSETDEERGFEVKHGGISHDVSLADMTCTFRVWDLTRVTCVHAISALLFMRKQHEAYVLDYYSYNTNLLTYHTLLNPIKGSKFWDMEGVDMVLPPNIAKKNLGRPKTTRRRDPNEERKKSGKASRVEVPTKCSNCGQSGHKRRNCPLPKQNAIQELQATE